MEPIEYSRFEDLDPYKMTDLERVLWGSVLVREERAQSLTHYYEFNGSGIDFDNDYLEWCQDYWSEPLGEDNARKRNHEVWRVACTLGLVTKAQQVEESAEEAYRNYEDDGMSSVVVNQSIRLLNWMDIDGLTLLGMDVKPYELVQRVWQSESSDEGRYRSSNRVGSGWPTETVSSQDKEWWFIEDLWTYDQVRSCQAYYPQLFLGRWVPLDDFEVDESLNDMHEAIDEARESGDWPDWAESKDRDILIRLGRN